jgi:hypothetical protein
MLVTVAADAVDDLETAVAAVISTASEHGLTVLLSERGDTLPGQLAGHEHFGFKDGISQPGIRGARSTVSGDEITPRYLAADDPHAALFGKPGQPLVWPGQFLLGEPRQDPQDPKVPAPASTAFPQWARLGSYVVVRRLAQDVVGFWDWMGSAAAAVEKIRADVEVLLDERVFLIADQRDRASEFSFYLRDKRVEGPGHPPVYIVESQDVENQFSFWPRYDEFVDAPRKPQEAEGDIYTEEAGVNLFEGRTALYLQANGKPEVARNIRSAFASVEPHATIEIRRFGKVMRTVQVFVCKSYRTLPL